MSSQSKAAEAKRFYTAYLDVLGVKDALEDDVLKYEARLIEFAKVIDSALYFHKAVRGWVFSDSAVMVSKDLRELLKSISEIRIAAMGKNDPMFVKGSVVLSEKADTLQAVVKKVDKERLYGFTFGRPFVRAYIAGERFKGIGIYVHESVQVADCTDLVPSVYFPQPTKWIPHAYRDISFGLGNNAYTSGTLAIILTTFYTAKIKSHRLQRFYVTLLCTWLGGMTQKDLVDESENGGALRFFDKLANGHIEKLFGSVEGRLYIYLAAWKVISQHFPKLSASETPSPIYRAAKYLGSFARLDRTLDDVPKAFFTRQNRDDFIHARLKHSGLASLAAERETAENDKRSSE